MERCTRRTVPPSAPRGHHPNAVNSGAGAQPQPASTVFALTATDYHLRSMARHDPPPTLPQTRPAGICAGPGHVLIYGNPAFHAQFGARCIGMPAREVMVDMPDTAFALFDAVLERGRPLARWIEREGRDWRLTAMPRRDPSTELVDGIAFHLRARDDVPVVEPVPGR